jgi:hypothetical protein
LTDTALLDCSLVKDRPSKIAAVSVYAAQSVFKGQSGSIWNSMLAKHTGYRESEVKGMAADLISFVKKIE